MPVTSWPASAARAAATAESTPPDIAARTFTRPRSSLRDAPRRTGSLDDRTDRLEQRIHVVVLRGVSQGEPERAPGLLVVVAHRQQHVRGLRHAGVARRPGRALDAAS